MRSSTTQTVLLLSMVVTTAASAGGDRVEGRIVFKQPDRIFTVTGTWRMAAKGDHSLGVPISGGGKELQWVCGEEGALELVERSEQPKLDPPDCDASDSDCRRQLQDFKKLERQRRTTVRVAFEETGLCRSEGGAWMGRLLLDEKRKRFRFEEARFSFSNNNVDPEFVKIDRWNHFGQPLGEDPYLGVESYWAGTGFEGAWDPKSTRIVGTWRDRELDRLDAETHGQEDHAHDELVVEYAFDLAPVEGGLTIGPTEPSLYDAWIPAPVYEEDDALLYGGSRPLKFSVELKSAAPGGPAPASRLVFRLRDVTRHKGRCTNFPKGEQPKYDLRFRRGQPGIEVLSDIEARTTDEVSGATVIVEATDTGAYGRLEVTAEKLGKSADVRIPRDDNGNRVADAWEKSRGIFERSLPGGWDEDPVPAGQRRNGDGYTLYEEYRGFIVLDAAGRSPTFIRTDPLKKDVFVHDNDRLIREYYLPHNPAELELHFVRPDMIEYLPRNPKDPRHRQVNHNSEPADWYARQFAIDVASFKPIDQKTAGAAESVHGLSLTDEMVKDPTSPVEAASAHGHFQNPLRSTWVVKIYSEVIFRNTQPIEPETLRTKVRHKLLESTVIHEFGHALGITHHSVDGKRPQNLQDEFAESGVHGCAMRYLHELEYRSVTVPTQTRFCRAGETAMRWVESEDENGDVIVDRLSRPSDNCFGQIDVKSDP